MDCSPPGSPVHGIFPYPPMEWVAISLSRGSSQPRDQTQARDRTWVSRTAGRCLPSEPPGKPSMHYYLLLLSHHKEELINETKTLWCTNLKYSLTDPVGKTSVQQAKHRQHWIPAPLSSSTALPCVGFITTLQGTFDKRHAQEWQRLGTSLVVQWLGLWASTAGGVGLIPGWGTKIPHAAWHDQKLKNKYKF